METCAVALRQDANRHPGGHKRLCRNASATRHGIAAHATVALLLHIVTRARTIPAACDPSGHLRALHVSSGPAVSASDPLGRSAASHVAVVWSALGMRTRVRTLRFASNASMKNFAAQLGKARGT